MKPIIIKGVAGTLGASGLVVGGYYGIEALTNEHIPAIRSTVEKNLAEEDNKKEKIKDKLNEDKYELLNSQPTSDQHWTNILDSYKKLSKTAASLKFDGFTGEEESAKEKLQELCNKNLESEDMSNYEKIKKWCVVPIDISNLLEKQGFVVLKTDDGDSSDNASWEKKIKDYKQLDAGTLKIEGLSLTENKEQAETSDYTNIKQKCSEIKTKKSYEDGFEKLLEKFVAWCANKN